MTAIHNLLQELKSAMQSRSTPDSHAPQDSDTQLLDHLNQVVFQIDAQGRLTFLNNAWETLTGFTIEESLNSPYFQYVHPNDREICTDNIISLLDQKQTSFSLRLRFLTRDENLCWIDMRANSMLNEEEQSLSIIGSLSDVTNRVHEAGLYQASYRTLSTILDNMCGLVYRGRNDHEWTMEFVSAGSTELTGYSPNDLINNSVTFATLIHPDDRESVWNEVQTALTQNRPFEIIYRIRTASGDEKWVWEQGRGNFSDSDELLSIEGFITDISEWKRNYLRTLHDSLYVEETGLPRRRLFINRLEFAWKRSTLDKTYSFAVFLIHIDRFKKLKDRYDKEVYSQICTTIVERLSELVGPLDTLSRMKEEEFGVLLDRVDNVTDVMQTAQRIQAALNQPLKIKDFNIFIRASMGIALSSAKHSSNDAIIRDANSALNRAISLGGVRFEIFDEDINARVSAQTRMQHELVTALDKNQLDFIYKPVVLSTEKRIDAIEAHLVWRHPRLGLLLADAFYPALEHSSIMPRLHEAMLSLLCEKITCMHDAYHAEARLRIKIRIFSESMLNRSFLGQLAHCLTSHQLDSFVFSLIVPEQLLVESGTEAIQSLQILEQKNIRICLDTADIGLLCTNNLARLSINSIKLNAGDLTQDRIQKIHASALIDFLHALEIDVTLSEINSDEDLQRLTSFRYEHIQGEAVSRTLNNDEILTLLSNPVCLHLTEPDPHAAE